MHLRELRQVLVPAPAGESGGMDGWGSQTRRTGPHDVAGSPAEPERRRRGMSLVIIHANGGVTAPDGVGVIGTMTSPQDPYPAVIPEEID